MIRKPKFLQENVNRLAGKDLRIFVFLILCGCSAKAPNHNAALADSWQELPGIIESIEQPSFRDADYNIMDYGAIGDGYSDCTEAFRKAIEACHSEGGGRVVAPEGVFLTGAIHLLSNVNLHLQDNAKIIFSRDTAKYLPAVFTRWEGMELMNYSPFIYAYQQENIAITGKGIIDGNASNEYWWPWKGRRNYGWREGTPHQNEDRELLLSMNEDQIPVEERVFGGGHYLRPQFIQPYECNKVLISGVTLINSPMWNIHPVLCENVTIENVRIQSLGPNNDGCNPESSRNVLIRNCYFNTGDDCIALKSGRNQDGRRIDRPAERIIIQNCTMKDGHGGIVIGSEISGGAKDIYAENCVMDSPQLDRVIRIKTSSQRGGAIENIFIRNIQVGQYKEAAIKCNMFYEDPGNYMPVIKNIVVQNLTVDDGGKYGILINAYKESPVTDIRLINCRINNVDTPVSVDNVKSMKLVNVKINGKEYSESL